MFVVLVEKWEKIENDTRVMIVPVGFYTTREKAYYGMKNRNVANNEKYTVMELTVNTNYSVSDVEEYLIKQYEFEF